MRELLHDERTISKKTGFLENANDACVCSYAMAFAMGVKRGNDVPTLETNAMRSRGADSTCCLGRVIFQKKSGSVAAIVFLPGPVLLAHSVRLSVFPSPLLAVLPGRHRCQPRSSHGYLRLPDL